MLNDFIGGGQVFLHKVRMFGQVFFRTLHVSLFLGILIGFVVNYSALKELDWDRFFSYRKAVLAVGFDDAMTPLRSSIGNNNQHTTLINARSGNQVWQNIKPSKVLRMNTFKTADAQVFAVGRNILILSISASACIFILIFLVWSRFGGWLKAERIEKGTNSILSANEVRKKLRAFGKASNLKIGNMPLVKDTETRHFLVTGSTGSGKTNLIHNILPQVQQFKQPAIVIDNTGEMIAKYYNPERGDIIFNPFDERGTTWDFWTDCSTNSEIDRFAKILIGFNRKQSGSYSDPFWEIAAQSVFVACAEFLISRGATIKELVDMVCYTDVGYLKTVLSGTEASRYLSDSKQTTSSILAVLAANSKPLKYLSDTNTETTGKTFSMKQYFADLKMEDNSKKGAWLFLATKPGSRDLTLPLLSCLIELGFAHLMESGIDRKQRMWLVIDELASLGKLPVLSTLMAEGRKYGTCVLAGLQSLNQLFENYGQYGGSTIFGQFGTSFFFKNNEPAIGRMFSSMCGSQTLTRQQKNTSFGANEFRDGVSYTEHKQKKALVDQDDLASLDVGECYVLLPKSSARLAKIKTPEINTKDKHQGFVEEVMSSLTKQRKINKEKKTSEATIKQQNSIANFQKTNEKPEDSYIKNIYEFET